MTSKTPTLAAEQPLVSKHVLVSGCAALELQLGCVHRLVFDDVNANDGAWRDEDVLASGLSRVAVEPAPKRRRRRGGEPAVRFTAPLSERQAVQGQYDDQQNRRP